MLDTCIPAWHSIHTIVFDFDGIFTDNKVWVDQDGKESVKCDRGDGLAFDMLRKFIRLHDWDLSFFILSTEINPVVSSRAKKLSIPCFQCIDSKAAYLDAYLMRSNKARNGLVYIGNDLNDIRAIQLSGFSIAPCDAHPLVRDNVNLVLSSKGGEGFVRQVVERILGFDKMSLVEILDQNLF
jgi:3-deoxy-D-manno-octulosonate 8-phosphate phosphatase (KDO 8-P phosphatase)